MPTRFILHQVMVHVAIESVNSDILTLQIRPRNIRHPLGLFHGNISVDGEKTAALKRSSWPSTMTARISEPATNLVMSAQEQSNRKEAIEKQSPGKSKTA